MGRNKGMHMNDMLKYLFPPAALVPQKTTDELRFNAISAIVMLSVVMMGAAAVHYLFGVS
jgi:hypothetical protein